MHSLIVEDDGKNIFGASVRKLRTERRLTQEGLAEKANVSLRYIQMIEAGVSFPRMRNLRDLRRALGCRWDDLLAKL
ncbi:MAG: helix-turn-helix domain-containing protein [Verrucomicrobiales bacterium]|nr:helix-turn-helix domain-containing protein [Verrucomicrobiales bacterium]